MSQQKNQEIPPPTLANTLNLSEFVCLTKELSPINSAMVFSGLMLSPALQSNNFRLEALVHLLLATSEGKEKLNETIAKKLFDKLDSSYYGISEDPAEDVMVTLAHHSTGSYRILEGLWEANAFQLQRFINLVDRMPDKAPYSHLKSSLRSLLKISDIIIERANLQKFLVGERNPLSEIPKEQLKSIEATSQLTMFTWDQLDELNIDPYDLSPFIYKLEQRAELLEVTTGASPIERQPIIEVGEEYNIVLPTAIGIAIRSLVIDFCHKNDSLEPLNLQFKHDYIKHFSKDISLLGKISNLPFQPIKNSHAVQAVAEQGNGLYFHFILAFDDFSNYKDSWFNGYSDNAEELGSTIEQQITKAYDEHISCKEGFRSGVTFIVGCGWGRPVSIPFNDPKLKNWSVVSLSAYDMTVFSQLYDFTPYMFLRLLEARTKIDKIGVNLLNINGLLNLYGYAKSNNFHLVNHDELPEEALQGSLLLTLSANSILEIRQEVYRKKDQHITQLPSGKNSMVSRVSGDWYFKDDEKKPLYMSLEELIDNDKLLGLIYGTTRKWWCSPCNIEEEMRDFIFRVWDGLCHWIYSLDKAFDSLTPQLMVDEIIWKWEIKQTLYPDNKVNHVPDYQELLSLTTTKSTFSKGQLEIISIFDSGFQSGFHKENNDAERAMLASLTQEVLTRLVSQKLTVENILDQVFVNSNAKYTHFLTAQTFKDDVKESLPKPIFVNEFDYATFRIGLGWLVSDIKDNPHIIGIRRCTTYLGKLVDAIWLEIKAVLSQLNKDKTIIMLLENHESLEGDAQWWRRTYKSAVGLHAEQARSVVGKQIALRNESTLGSRLALEMALCECKSEDGYTPSNMDITKLISYATFMFQMGGVSDAIQYEMIPAKIRIAPTGDVLFDQSFHTEIIKPYGSITHKQMLQQNINKYADNFNEPKIVEAVEPLLEVAFNHAWLTEYGFSIDNGRAIIEFLENEGININKAVFELSVKQFFNLGNIAELEKKVLESFLESMSLEQRKSWDQVPPNFNMNDILPWRFKRRLSAISRPILKTGDTLIIAPGLVKNGFLYLVRNCHQGSFDNTQFKSKEMQQWIGKTRSKAGHQFNKDVADEFRANGWKAESDVFLTKLLNKKLDKDYGDIDVVAWNPKTGKVLLVECKDLEFAKTPSEIAKQIYEFRGVKREDNGKADRLLKHLERIRVITENKDLLTKTMKLKTELSLEGCLVFSRLVPLNFSDMEKLKQVTILSFDKLKEFELLTQK